MSGLRISLSALERGAYEIDASVPEEELQPEGAKQLALGPTHIRGKMTAVLPQYVFMGALAGAYLRQCDRCLVDTEVRFAHDVLWTFQHGALREDTEGASEHDVEAVADDESETVYFEGADIDLGRQAWEELVLLAPSKALCKDDCAGLCPQCGVNRNESPCGCECGDEPTILGNKGLSGLANLFPDLDPNHPKE